MAPDHPTRLRGYWPCLVAESNSTETRQSRQGGDVFTTLSMTGLNDRRLLDPSRSWWFAEQGQRHPLADMRMRWKSVSVAIVPEKRGGQPIANGSTDAQMLAPIRSHSCRARVKAMVVRADARTGCARFSASK